MPNVANTRILLLGTENADGTVAGVTTGQSRVLEFPSSSYVTFYLTSIGTTSGGTIVIEEADFAPATVMYNGIWGAIQTISASTFTGGQQLPVHIMATPYGYLKIRISSPITGGGSIMASLRSTGSSN